MGKVLVQCRAQGMNRWANQGRRKALMHSDWLKAQPQVQLEVGRSVQGLQRPDDEGHQQVQPHREFQREL